MPQCSAFGCTNKSDRSSDKSFHRFPFSRQDDTKIWIQNIRRENWVPTKHSLLCSDHFTEDCFDRTGQTVRIRNGASPTKFNFTKQVNGRRTLPRTRKKLKSIRVEDIDLDARVNLVVTHDHNYYVTVEKLMLDFKKDTKSKRNIEKMRSKFKESEPDPTFLSVPVKAERLTGLELRSGDSEEGETITSDPLAFDTIPSDVLIKEEPNLSSSEDETSHSGDLLEVIVKMEIFKEEEDEGGGGS